MGEQEVPDVTIPCDQCRRNFTKKVNSPATKCVQCYMDNAAREAALMQTSYAAPQEADDAAWRVLKVFLYIGVVALLVYLKWQIRHG